MSTWSKLLHDIGIIFYQHFWISFLLAVLFMFVLLFCEKFGWRKTIRIWLRRFQKSRFFRRGFVFVFYASMLLSVTLLSRNIWDNPLSDVLGSWQLRNEDGSWNLQIIENFLLFLPFTSLCFWAFGERVIGMKITLIKAAYRSTVLACLTSLAIEILQLILRLGTFQLSDLFFNTLGGLSGGVAYYAGSKIRDAIKRQGK